MMKAIVIKVNENLSSTATAVEVDKTLETLQMIVGGLIVEVYIDREHGNDGTHMYVNEEGKFRGLPFNSQATILARLNHGIPDWDVISGDVVILGDGGGGREGDCPEWVYKKLGLS